eukprot:2256257-Pyramimonas_sp.AAC.1
MRSQHQNTWSDPQPRHGIRADGDHASESDHVYFLMRADAGYLNVEGSYHSLRPAGVPPCTRAPRMATLAGTSSALLRCLLLGFAA